MRLLITGGAGFIGSTLIKYIIKETDHSALNLDNLTYASNLNAIEEVSVSAEQHLILRTAPSLESREAFKVWRNGELNPELLRATQVCSQLHHIPITLLLHSSSQIPLRATQALSQLSYSPHIVK